MYIFCKFIRLCSCLCACVYGYMEARSQPWALFIECWSTWCVCEKHVWIVCVVYRCMCHWCACRDHERMSGQPASSIYMPSHVPPISSRVTGHRCTQPYLDLPDLSLWPVAYCVGQGGQSARPMIHLCLPAQHWDYKCMLPFLFFMWVPGLQMQAPTHVQEAL